MIPITDRIRQFTDAIETYLKANDAYRATSRRWPRDREASERAKNAAFQNTQTLNGNLHSLLSRYPEPDILRDYARELIRCWDKRNTCFLNLKNITDDDHPNEALQRLQRAERELRAQLKKVQELLQTLATN